LISGAGTGLQHIRLGMHFYATSSWERGKIKQAVYKLHVDIHYHYDYIFNINIYIKFKY